MKIKDMLYILWTQTHDDTGWLELSAGIGYRRENGWVYVQIEGLPKPSSNVIGTLPVGFRPSQNVQPYIRTSSGTPIVAWISTAGTITVDASAIPSSTAIAGFVAFPV